MPLATARQPLSTLLAGAPDSDRRVAFTAGQATERSHAELLRDVRGLLAATGPGERWLVKTEDAYHVAVALLAAAANGSRLVLPPNLRPATLDSLRAECGRVLDDAAFADLSDADARPLPPLDRDAPMVELFTSGSSGPGKLVIKALRHLEDEVVELERLFGADIAADAEVLATVPAHHLYGLLFRVLWPLATARPFCRSSFLLPEDLLARVGAAEHVVVISSPAHLRHLAASQRLGDQSARLDAVFSSGGPLETATALSLEETLGRGPIEIFGSTETGGVAWRRASASDPSPLWKCFAPVSVATAEDGALLATSPFVTPPETDSENEKTATTTAGNASASCWRMGDRIEQHPGGFRLLGRTDRIAKIGEKSLSLPEIEAKLGEHPLVENAMVETFAYRGGQRLGALVVLSKAGLRQLSETGRRGLQGELGRHIAAHWDRIALPRRWRFLDELPTDERGKLSQDSFQAVISQPAAEPREPLCISQFRDGDDDVFEFVVPRDLAYFDGHYDAFPLVPGAVQIHWVMSTLSRHLGGPVSAERMEAIKFKSVLRPAQEFCMRLHIEGSRVSFTLAHEERVFSSGRITLAA